MMEMMLSSICLVACRSHYGYNVKVSMQYFMHIDRRQRSRKKLKRVLILKLTPQLLKFCLPLELFLHLVEKKERREGYIPQHINYTRIYEREK